MARVLVVDDEPAIRSLIRSTLERAGHTAFEAGDGLEGLEAAQHLLPDLILLDVALPRLNGLEVCKRLRADRRTAGALVLLLTGLPVAGAGADGCISKPFTPSGIGRQIEQALRLRREAATHR